MAPTTVLKFVWMEVTGFCNEFCDHCYADSGPQGTHGTMTRADWIGVIDEVTLMGARDVQFIGGEPTLYPHLPELIRHARRCGLNVEVFSNMTVISAELWETFTAYGVKLATSYYSDDAAEHDAVTHHKGAHRKTRANIEKALRLKIPIRGGVVSVRSGQRVRGAVRDLGGLGVREVGTDRTRTFGRGSDGAAPTVADLCGHCAQGKCAVLPDGSVSPCVLGRFVQVGNVHEQSLREIWTGLDMATARNEIRQAHPTRGADSCTPPQFLPMCGPCGPCPPSVGACDPRKAGASGEAPDSIGAPS